jgi:ribosomal protein L35AE/L33A
VETIEFIEAKNLNYHLGNAVKYISRAFYKGNPLQDLKKARFYIDREIARRESKAA